MCIYSVADAFARKWWLLLLRGIFAVLFGVLAFALPGITLLTLVLLYGIYALADGLTALWIGGISRAWGLVCFGVLGVIVGILTFLYPGLTAVALLCLIAAWAIVRGLFEIITAIRLRKEMNHEWLLILGGIISILFGVVFATNLAAGALALVWFIGAYALIFGLTLSVFAFRMRAMPGLLERLVART